VDQGKVKIRIMFTQNAYRPGRLRSEHHANQYAILYYYFIRHAFGLIYSPLQPSGVRIRVYPDTLPLKPNEVAQFKDFVVRLGNRTEFRNRRLLFSRENVTEVISHDHDILQCLDIILGAMNFRLNKRHLDKPEGAVWRSAKTRTKEKIYQRINKRIQNIYPRFNIGITTGHQGDIANRWKHLYRHWNFRTGSTWR
jgi:hypothetical protein